MPSYDHRSMDNCPGYPMERSYHAWQALCTEHYIFFLFKKNSTERQLNSIVHISHSLAVSCAMKIVQSWIAAQGDPGTDGRWQGCSNVGSQCVDQDDGHFLRISDAGTPFVRNMDQVQERRPRWWAILERIRLVTTEHRYCIKVFFAGYILDQELSNTKWPSKWKYTKWQGND